MTRRAPLIRFTREGIEVSGRAISFLIGLCACLVITVLLQEWGDGTVTAGDLVASSAVYVLISLVLRWRRGRKDASR